MRENEIDFDFWTNTKKEIILELLKSRVIDSVSDLSVRIGKVVSYCHEQVLALQSRNILTIKKEGNKNVITLAQDISCLADALHKHGNS